ncbi:MAG: alpha/beta fold hydrolase [Actinomycetota bacterium]
MAVLSFDQLIVELSRARIVMRADGDRLSVNAPEGAVTPELADAIRAHKPALLEYLVDDIRPILASDAGDRPKAFCVHGTGGNIMFLRHWAEHVEQVALYGIESPGCSGRTDLAESLKQMVDDYVRAVRSAQPHGPYVLMGYSAGGIIAMEMARALAGDGEDVPLLVLLDTFRTDHAQRSHSGLERAQQIVTSPVRFATNVLQKKVLDPRAYEDYSRRVVQHLERGERLPVDLREQYMEDHMLSLLAEHELSDYPGRVVLITASDVNVVERDAGPDRGWSALVDELVLEEIDCDHHALVGRRRAEDVAAVLDRIVADAVESPTA